MDSTLKQAERSLDAQLKIAQRLRSELNDILSERQCSLQPSEAPSCFATEYQPNGRKDSELDGTI
jgi:hypothetical protein